MLRRHLLLTPYVLILSACRDQPPPMPDRSAPSVVVVDLGTVPEPWRAVGQLVGTTDTRAILLSDNVVSVEISTGASVSAATGAEDPRPNFDRLLPRHGEGEMETVQTDRLPDAPIYVGGGVVVFMRGTEAALTSLVGLDAATLEERWVFALSEQLPVKSCATEVGVLVVPRAGEPARVVDWSGQQKWLRELAGRNESIESVTCGEGRVEVQVRGRKKSRTIAYDAVGGDLRADAEDVLPRETPTDPRVRQSEGEVERVVAH